MECDICGRAHNAQTLPFLCAVDARNRLYEPRFVNALALMEREDLEKKANEALSDPERLDILRSEQQLTLDRTGHILAQAERLREEVEAAKREICDKRAALSRRKADFATAANGVDARRAARLRDAETSIGVAKYKWKQVSEITATNRAYLCMEAARLYGLRRIKKATSAKYEIGHVEVVELFGMNSVSPETVSTAFANIAHILVLASHYLAIRLPAEITLPHRDYPRPTIFPVLASYQHPDIPFPGTSNLQLHGSRDGESRLPRPRPLYVDKALPVLAKEEPWMYNLFIEGVTLLAYDIAWACCSQGIALSDRDEDICNMGQNLYRLLIGNQLLNNPAAQIFAAPAPADGRRDAKGEGNVETEMAKNLMGWYSHGGAHGSLATAEGAEFIRSFKLPSPARITDRVKKRLLYEAPMLEWETIDSEDARTADDEEGDGVLVKGHRQEGSAARRLWEVESVATVASSTAIAASAANNAAAANGRAPASAAAGSERPRFLGANGWTKLKSR